MQYVTAMKCVTTHKKLGKLGVLWEKIDIFPHYAPIFLPILPHNWGTPSL